MYRAHCHEKKRKRAFIGYYSGYSRASRIHTLWPSINNHVAIVRFAKTFMDVSHVVTGNLSGPCVDSRENSFRITPFFPFFFFFFRNNVNDLKILGTIIIFFSSGCVFFPFFLNFCFFEFYSHSIENGSPAVVDNSFGLIFDKYKKQSLLHIDNIYSRIKEKKWKKLFSLKIMFFAYIYSRY